jgi:predicted cobalt transporter CbtA
MKTWLKGGLLAVPIALVLSIIISFIICLVYSSSLVYILQLLSLTFLLPGMIIIAGISFKIWAYEAPSTAAPQFILAAIISIIIYFLIGALIGYIIQKVKGGKGKK